MEVFEGRKFNNLTVNRLVSKGKYRSFDRWLCDCECGGYKIMISSQIKLGKTKSCGCLRKSTLPGESGFNTLYWVYRVGAKNRNYFFDESLEFKNEFKLKTKENCTYCDSAPSMVRTNFQKNRTSDHTKKHASYVYNGIDRVDNSKGYEFGNIVACCKICNIAKSTLTVEEFKNWINRAYRKMNQNG